MKTPKAILSMLLLCCGCAAWVEIPITPLPTPVIPILLPTDTEPAPTATPISPTQTPLSRTAAYPTVRRLQGFAYDAESEKSILFGGAGSGGEFTRDTWTFDHTTQTWHQLTPGNPPPKGDVTMAYDAESDRVILFQGAQSPSDYYHFTPSGATWAYDTNTNTWTDMSPEFSPYNLVGSQMVYDSESDRMVLFGGWDTTESFKGASSQTWIYDFNSNTWRLMEPKESPPGRKYHSMAYDEGADRVILWGGGGPVTVETGETWAYDTNTNTWTLLETRAQPAPTMHAAMVYDQHQGQILLYARKELWSFTFADANWVLLSSTPEPGKLTTHSMVYYPPEHEVVIFGGGHSFITPKNETWILDCDTLRWMQVSGG